jgi:acetyl-CoA/propionyl-CoA carboxylase biotin carboxyl carrier protein
MARRRLLRALDEFILEGPPTTIPFHQLALQQPEFIQGTATTAFVSRLDLSALSSTARHLPQAAVLRAPSEPEQMRAIGSARRFQVRVEGKPYTVEVAELQSQPGNDRRERMRRGSGAAADGAVVSPMHGVVIRVPVEEGATVEQGAVLCVVEAMKMENEILAPHPGTITGVAVRAGDTVDAGALLLRVVP